MFYFLFRSYGRYYYRNKATGSIQWDFPKTETLNDGEKGKNKSKKRTHSKPHIVERPKTPPPPVISDQMIPPPPPVISNHEFRKRRTSPKYDSISELGIDYLIIIIFFLSH